MAGRRGAQDWPALAVPSKAEVAGSLAAGLSQLRQWLPVRQIALLNTRAAQDPNSSEQVDLLVVYSGARRHDAADLVRQALDITALEPRVLSLEEYAESRNVLDPLVATGTVLYKQADIVWMKKPPRRPWRRGLRWVGSGLMALGMGIILSTGGFYAYSSYSLSGMNQGSDSGQVVTAIQAASEEGPAPAEDTASSLAALPGVGGSAASSAFTPPASSVGDEVPWEGITYWPLGTFPAVRIIIPSINVDSKIIDIKPILQDGEWQWETPKNAVGHLRGTGQPGESTNTVLAGHIDSPQRGEGDVFRRLPEIKLGDTVIVYTQVRALAYQVTGTKVVLPEQVSVLNPTNDETVTLITCVPDFIYSHRLIVTAKLVSAVK
ncbi:MAG: sortase [Dehalococcoidia bacterium]|nr:sortase [Dehalococcoidia bacterium]